MRTAIDHLDQNPNESGDAEEDAIKIATTLE